MLNAEVKPDMIDADLEPEDLSNFVSDLTCSSRYRYMLHRTKVRHSTDHFLLCSQFNAAETGALQPDHSRSLL